MFNAWHDFFLLIGTAAAALIGWLFVVATLTSGSPDRDRAAHGLRVYSTPTVFHLAMIVLISAIALMPSVSVFAVAGAAAVAAAIGLPYCAYVGREIRSGRIGSHKADVWLYGVATAIVYAVLLAAGIGLGARCPAAPWMLAGGLLALQLLSIHNSWDLVTWMAPRANNHG